MKDVLYCSTMGFRGRLRSSPAHPQPALCAGRYTMRSCPLGRLSCPLRPVRPQRAADHRDASLRKRRRKSVDLREHTQPCGCEGPGQVPAGASLPGTADLFGEQCLPDRWTPCLQPGSGGADCGHPPGVRHLPGPAGVRRGAPVLCPQGPHREAGAFFNPPAAGRSVRLSQAL